MSQELFTASQIAKALEISRQAVHKRLASIPATVENSQGGGVIVKQWALDQLPEEYHRKLGELQRSCGYADKAALLTDEDNTAWQPPVPWDQVPQKFREKAQRLMRALLPALERRNEPGLHLTEFGLQKYRDEFGRDSIGADRWNQLLQRTLKRDGNRENWRRLEIYLDDAAFRPTPVVAEKHFDQVTEYEHAILNDEFAQVPDLTKPTRDDRAYIWDAVFRHYETLLEQYPDDERGIRTSLIEYVHAAMPGLSGSREGMFKQFKRFHERWQEAGGTVDSVTDGRKKSGYFRRPQFEKDLQLLAAEAVIHGGHVSLAHRQLYTKGKYTQEFREHYKLDLRTDKSYVPHEVRKEVTPLIQATMPLFRGPKQARLARPSVQRDWSAVHPGQFFTADDVTWNSYFWYQDEVTGEYVITRGECLVFTDLRTFYPLDFLLIAGKYNSWHIKKTITRINDVHGLPDAGFYFERGIWKARIISGATGKKDKEGMPWRETECGLRDYNLGLEVMHATVPRAKPIEGMFHILQDRMRSERGFVGFNERTEKMERTQDKLMELRRSKEHPGDEFMSMEQWATRIAMHLEEFADEPQNGKMLDGQSPAEAWAARIKHRPLRKLPDEARYLLSTHKKPVRVTAQGIRLTINGKPYQYAGEATANYIGRDMLAFFSIETPELLTVSNLDRTEFFTLRALELPAMTATAAELRGVRTALNAHTKPAQELFGKIKHSIVSTVTEDNRYSDEVKDLGRFHEEAVKVVGNERKEHGRTAREIRKLSAELGTAVPVPADARNAERVAEGLRLEQEARARIAAEEAAENGDN